MSIPNQTATLSKEDYDIFLEKVEIAKTKGVTIEYSLKVDTFVPSWDCLLYTSPSPRDRTRSRMPSSA